ncbi:hypothetical protein BaRGS_00010294, partial [Batillaria attramentaria]
MDGFLIVKKVTPAPCTQLEVIDEAPSKTAVDQPLLRHREPNGSRDERQTHRDYSSNTEVSGRMEIWLEKKWSAYCKENPQTLNDSVEHVTVGGWGVGRSVGGADPAWEV